MGSNKPQEVRVVERQAQLEHSLAPAPHESVAHVKTEALRYVAAANAAIEEDKPIHALYLIGIAEGVANALADVAGLEGLHEVAVREIVGRRAIEIRLLVERKA
jgi:hypothetical protein